MMTLTRDEVLHLAQLCRITLQPEEGDRFAQQLSSVLEYVGKLQEVDVDVATEAVANITGLENVMRDDAVRACTAEERERMLAQFPMREGDLLKTRGVFSA